MKALKTVWAYLWRWTVVSVAFWAVIFLADWCWGL